MFVRQNKMFPDSHEKQNNNNREHMICYNPFFSPELRNLEQRLIREAGFLLAIPHKHALWNRFGMWRTGGARRV